MYLFSILAPILGAMASISFIAPALGGAPNLRSDRGLSRYVRDPAIKAFFYVVPVFIIHIGYRQLIPIDAVYRVHRLFLHAFFGETFGFAVLVAVGSFWLNRQLRDDAPGELFTAHTVFFLVAYAGFAVGDALMHSGIWSFSDAILVPIVRLSTIVVFPVAMTVADTVHRGGWAALLLIFQPLVAAVPPMLLGWLLPGAALVVTLGLVVGSAVAVWSFVFRAGA